MIQSPTILLSLAGSYFLRKITQHTHVGMAGCAPPKRPPGLIDNKGQKGVSTINFNLSYMYDCTSLSLLSELAGYEMGTCLSNLVPKGPNS